MNTLFSDNGEILALDLDATYVHNTVHQGRGCPPYHTSGQSWGNFKILVLIKKLDFYEGFHY